MTPLIIVLGLLAVAGIGVTITVYRIRQKVRSFSRAVFGTDSFIDGYRQQADVLAEQPKSVCGMTRLMEPMIAKDFPDFSWAQFRGKAENLLTKAFRAISAGDVTILESDVSAELREQIRNIIENNAASGTKETYDQVTIYQTEIANYSHEDGKCIILIQSAVGHLHYKERDGRVIEGTKDRRTQTRYAIELVYIQNAEGFRFDNAVGTTCPNCGAPVTNLGFMHCDYCGAAVTPINIKVWSLHKFYEVDYNHV